MAPSTGPDAIEWVALVVEDEPRLRQALVEHLRASSFAWRSIREASSAEEALAACREELPDVAFLDIRLPGTSGLELASRLPSGTHLVFVTAYDAHAVAAFEAGAVDYLLKPVTPERLHRTLERLRGRSPLPAEALRRLLEGIVPAAAPSPKEPLRWVTASSGRKTHWIAVEDVLFFRADNKYTRVECRDASYLVDTTIRELAGQLDPATFRQVHRSTIVNLRSVAWVEKEESGGGTIHLRGHDALLAVSAPYLKSLKA